MVTQVTSVFAHKDGIRIACAEGCSPLRGEPGRQVNVSYV